MCGFGQQGSADPDEVDEAVVLVGGEDSLEECHQVRLLSDWEWPLCHGDALRLHGLLEGILVRVILEGEVGDVLFNKDVGIPGGDDVEVMTGDGDLQSPELMVPGMEAEGGGYPDSIHSGLGPALTDVLGELSDRSADVHALFSGVVVVLGNIQGLQDQPGLLGDKGDKGFTTLLRRVVDSDDRDRLSRFFSRLLDMSDSWHWCLWISVDFLRLRVVRIRGIQYLFFFISS